MADTQRITSYLDLSLNLANNLNDYFGRPNTSLSYWNTLVPVGTKHDEVFDRVLKIQHDSTHNLWANYSKEGLAFRVSYADLQKDLPNCKLEFHLTPYYHFHFILELDTKAKDKTFENKISFFQLHQLDVCNLFIRSDKQLRVFLLQYIDTISNYVDHPRTLFDDFLNTLRNLNNDNISVTLDFLSIFYSASNFDERLIFIILLAELFNQMKPSLVSKIQEIAFSPAYTSINKLYGLILDDNRKFPDLEKSTSGGWIRLPYKEISLIYLDFGSILNQITTYRGKHPLGPAPPPM